MICRKKSSLQYWVCGKCQKKHNCSNNGISKETGSVVSKVFTYCKEKQHDCKSEDDALELVIKMKAHYKKLQQNRDQRKLARQRAGMYILI